MMSLIGDLIRKMRNAGGDDTSEVVEVDDDVTTDKVLKGLRRQRRVQQEELEKVQLRKDIAEFNRDRSRNYLWGIKDNDKNTEGLVSKGPVGNILKQKNVMVGGSNVFKQDKGLVWRDRKIKRIKSLLKAKRKV